MTKEELLELTQKYLNGTLSDAERQTLQDWYRQSTNDEIHLHIPAFHANENEAEMKASLLARIHAQSNEAHPLNRPAFVRNLWRRYVSVAAILILLATGGYFLTNRNRQLNHIVDKQVSANDIAPGFNKATLILGNGRRIVLDSAQNGKIAEQGRSAVIKTDSGKLSYAAQNQSSAAIVYNTLITPRGGQYRLELPDGTKVWLNAASSIKYPTSFTGNERKVTITGEAFFEVVHNGKMPFRVEANGVMIEDLGTEFNINAYSNEPEIKTTLIAGSIKVIRTERKDSKVLKPGEQASVAAAASIKVINDVDTELVLAWKNGMQSYSSADIYTVMREVERWYDVDVEFAGALSQRTFSGDIPRSAKLSELLKLFEATQIHFSIDREKRKLTVIP